MAEVESDKEPWSWGKFFGGFFNGINTAKAIQMIWHQAVVITVVIALCWFGYSIFGKFTKKSTPPAPPIKIETNSGKVITSSDDRRKTCLFLNLCF